MWLCLCAWEHCARSGIPVWLQRVCSHGSFSVTEINAARVTTDQGRFVLSQVFSAMKRSTILSICCAFCASETVSGLGKVTAIDSLQDISAITELQISLRELINRFRDSQRKKEKERLLYCECCPWEMPQWTLQWTLCFLCGFLFFFCSTKVMAWQQIEENFIRFACLYQSISQFFFFSFIYLLPCHCRWSVWVHSFWMILLFKFHVCLLVRFLIMSEWRWMAGKCNLYSSDSDWELPLKLMWLTMHDWQVNLMRWSSAHNAWHHHLCLYGR